MTTSIIKCINDCCTIKVNMYRSNNPAHFKRHNKAGMFIYDPNEDRVLFVQSRGHLWGPPKGSLDEGEKEIDSAIREVKEETGLNL